MKKQFKLLLVGVAITQVIGCASLELMAVGGVSYLLTGKGLSDHALSLTLDQDCALHRVLTQGNVCVDNVEKGVGAETMLASNANDNRTFDQKTADQRAAEQIANNLIDDYDHYSTGVTNDDGSTKTIASNPTNSEQLGSAISFEESMILESGIESIDSLIDIQVPERTEVDAQVYAVVGSFNDLKFAFERSLLYRIYNTQIIETPKGSTTKYRVVVGPLDDKGLISHIPNKVGTQDQPHWGIELCPETLMPPPCAGQLLAKNM